MPGREPGRVARDWQPTVPQRQGVRSMSDTDYLRLKPRSADVTEGPQRAPARAMLRAVGMRDEDFRKPIIAVASSWNEVTPCNLHLDKLADRAKAGVREA